MCPVPASQPALLSLLPCPGLPKPLWCLPPWLCCAGQPAVCPAPARHLAVCLWSCKPVLYVPMCYKHIVCVIPSCQPSRFCQPYPSLVCDLSPEASLPASEPMTCKTLLHVQGQNQAL